ncbi:MAG: MEDS domain-containing protein [Gemmatimonadetes bacterium]|nr:MEDS domain-containing protein [Gemmatimonadota bacterium]
MTRYDQNGRDKQQPPGERPPGEVDWDHVAQFYDSDDFLFGSVAPFVADGILLRQPVVLLSTAAHRDGFRTRLAQAGVDWQEARRTRRLRWMDARVVLESIMVGRIPDPGRFERHVGSVIRAAVAAADGARIRAYGELVDLLCEGKAEAALRLEDMWNELARSLPFSLLCAYSRGNIYQETRDQRIRQVCDCHARVLPSEDGVPAGR